MGSCLSTHPGDAPAWPQWWRKRHRCGEVEGAAATGGVFFSSSVGGGGKLPGEGEMMTEEELARVAGRTCANGASAAACLHTQQGRKGTNQDAMLVWEVSYRQPLFFLSWLGSFFRWIQSPDQRRRSVHGRKSAAFLSQLLAFTPRSLL